METTTSTHQNPTEDSSSPPPTNDCGSTHGRSSQHEASHQQPSSDESAPMQSKEFLVWRKPWITALVLFFVFYVTWASGVIVKRYWIVENWDLALPGLGENALRKLSMRSHMTFGGLAILCSPIQMLTPFTSAWKKTGASMIRNWYRRIHRYSGRLYVICAILSFFFGQWFIILKKFELVGGYNMGVAFSVAGFFIAYFAYMTWKTAPGRDTSGRYTIEDHRNYAIRSFSQIIAPVLYRYWYTLLIIFKAYRVPYLNGGDASKGENLVCDARNVCGDYLRPFDAIYCWLYWMSAWAVAEIVISCLPSHQKQVTASSPVEEDEMEKPLLERMVDDENSHSGSDDANTENNDLREESSSSGGISNDKDGRKILVVDLVGCLLALLTVMVTGSIFYIM